MVGRAGLGNLEMYLDSLFLVGSGIDPSGAGMERLSVAGACSEPLSDQNAGWGVGTPYS